MDQEKLERLLRLGIEKGASDIHFQVGYLPLYRFNGELVELRFKVLTAADTEAMVRMLLEGDPRAEAMGFSEIDLAYELPNEGRFRVNISRQRRCFNIVLRVIPLQIRSFDELNLPAVLRDFADHYTFDEESEDYLVHITTGTHVVQICLFLLTETRHLPARLIQTSPAPRARCAPRHAM